jgi:hypothetical protein
MRDVVHAEAAAATRKGSRKTPRGRRRDLLTGLLYHGLDVGSVSDLSGGGPGSRVFR